MFTKYYCKNSIYAFVRDLTNLTLSNVMEQHLLGWDLRIKLQLGVGGVAQVGHKAQKWRGFKSVRTPYHWELKISLEK